jgi:hypothetical protein
MKRAMLSSDIPAAVMFLQSKPADLKQEHVALYNLLGDPALRLRYPERVEFQVQATQQKPYKVSVQADDVPVRQGRAVVTLEIRRTAMLEPLEDVPARDVQAAMAAMARNWERAQKKVVTRVEAAVEDGEFSAVLTAEEPIPQAVVKVLVVGRNKAASGYRFLEWTPQEDEGSAGSQDDGG